jgi:hypothetical protein
MGAAGLLDRLVNQLNEVFGSALEIDWLPRVRLRDRSQHELTALREGLAGYRISALGPDGAPIPASDQDEYFPIFYARGGLSASPNFGLDIRSDPAQKEAIERARYSDAPAATLPVDHADSGLPSNVFVFAPVFAFDTSKEAAQDRRINIDGFIRSAFPPGPLIGQGFRAVKLPRGLDIYFFQPEAAPNALPFHIRSSLLRSGRLSRGRAPTSKPDCIGPARSRSPTQNGR